MATFANIAECNELCAIFSSNMRKVLEKNVCEDESGSMEGIGCRGGVRAPCKRFAIKGIGSCDRSALGFDGHKARELLEVILEGLALA